MRILFLVSSIYSTSGGLGGHYHSLLETVAQVQKIHECFIVNIGSAPAKALSKYNGNIKFISFHSFRPFSVYRELANVVTSNSIDVVHSFDRVSFFWARVLKFRTDIGCVLTKCGGPNQGYLPYCSNTVFYSLENLNYYKNRFSSETENFQLVPNRIVGFKSDWKRIQDIRALYLDADLSNHKVLLRICRVGNVYKESIIAFIELVNSLNRDSIPSVGIIIGTIEDHEVFSNLNRHSEDLGIHSKIVFIADDIFTQNAKELIDIADIVLGTGRSFMEAASKRKPLVFPLFDGSLAILTPENFQDAFYYNFSQRVKIQNFDSHSNYFLIKSVLVSVDTYNLFSEYSECVFSKFFDASRLGEIYSKIYENSRLNSESIELIDCFKNFLLILKVYSFR